jgi:hypothetical protein
LHAIGSTLAAVVFLGFFALTLYWTYAMEDDLDNNNGEYRKEPKIRLNRIASGFKHSAGSKESPP